MFSDYRLLKQLRDAGKLTLRYAVLLPAMGPTDPVAFRRRVEASGIKPNEGDAWLRVWGVKTLVDGGFEGGHMSHAYAEPYGMEGKYHGLTVIAPEQYNALVKTIHDLGFRIASHAVGDAAVDQVLDAYEKADAERSIKGEHWVIEHVFVTRPDQYPRMKRLGLVLSVQDHLFLAAPTLKNYWGAERAEHVTPVRTYLDQGFLLAGGTDTPVVPYNPFWAMYHFLSRDTISAGVYGPSEAVPSREQVLRMFTSNYAKLINEDADKGSIEKGKLADFVVLSGDFMTVPIKQIEDMKALATYVEGRPVYRDASDRF